VHGVNKIDDCQSKVCVYEQETLAVLKQTNKNVKKRFIKVYVNEVWYYMGAKHEHEINPGKASICGAGEEQRE